MNKRPKDYQPLPADHWLVQIAAYVFVIVTFGIFAVLGVKLIQWLWNLGTGCGV